MEDRIVGLARVLRQHGVRTSPAEVAEATRAAALVGLEDRWLFRAALRSTLVKRSADVPVFDRLFDLYFSGLGRLVDRVERSLEEELLAAGVLGEEDAEKLSEALSLSRPSMSPLAQATLEGDRARLLALLHAAAAGLDFSALAAATQVGFFGRRLLAAAGGAAAERDLSALEAALRDLGLSERALDAVSEHLARALRSLEAAARRYAELERDARARRAGTGALADKPFAALSREEIQRVEAAVRRLAERLKSRLVNRERSRRRGALAVRRTLRQNVALGGYPARLAFRRRRPERPDVVVLCDVSDSVRHVARLMLLFLYTLQSLFTRVRSFVFVSDLGEVTQAFREERDVSRAVDVATAGQVVSLWGNSNYGRALALLHREHLGAIGRRTTVIVIGDGRTNYHAPGTWIVRELGRKARQVLWICPEERWAWGQGDSEMPAYAREVDRVAVVTCLAELELAAETLVPRRG